MECKEFEKEIPLFIAGEVDDKTMLGFLEHIEKCPDCKEELIIQVLVQEGMARLEDGSAFDLQKELDRKMQEARKRIRRHRTVRAIRITLEITAVAAAGIVLALFLGGK